jgi:hypothetical protein
MPRVTDDNKYGQCNGGAETAESGACSVVVTTGEKRDRTGRRLRGGTVWSFWASSWDSPSRSGSAGKAVVVDGVDVFLDLGAEVLDIERTEISGRGQCEERRDRVSRVARAKEGGVHVCTVNDPCNPFCVGCFSRSERCYSP